MVKNGSKEIKNLTQLKGQNQAIELLSRAIALNRVAPAYLFSGPDGVGRSQAARGFAILLLSQGLTEEKKQITHKQVLDLNHPDLLWVEPTYLHQGQLITATEAADAAIARKTAPQIRIEQIRGITEFLGRPPLFGPRSLVVIEDANQMTEASANALLKTLEEPGLATLMLIANSNQALLPTLVSRCQRIPFSRLSDEELTEVLREQNYSEIISHPEILTLAQGSPGKAIAIATQLQSISPSLLDKLKHPPKTILDVFTLAKEVVQELDTEGQLWLIDYLQIYYWQSLQLQKIAQTWEQAHQFMHQYVNPRLVWECSLLDIFNCVQEQ